MKAVLIRIFALAILAGSISAIATVPSKDEKMGSPCPPAAAGASQSNGAKSHEKEMKKEKQKMKKEKEQKEEDDNYPGFGIFG
jgi:ribosomal protein L12E/L44/L45/RPP1/RPP2